MAEGTKGKEYFQNCKSCYKHKFRHIKKWVKCSGNLLQRSQKVLWNQNFICLLVLSSVLVHNGKAKKTNSKPKQKRTKPVDLQCNCGGTCPPQSTSSSETQTSQSSSRVISINIFTCKHTPTKFHYWLAERLPNISAPLRHEIIFSAAAWCPQAVGGGSFAGKSHLYGPYGGPVHPAVDTSTHLLPKEPIDGAQSGKPKLQNNFLEQLGLLGGLLGF